MLSVGAGDEEVAGCRRSGWQAAARTADVAVGGLGQHLAKALHQVTFGGLPQRVGEGFRYVRRQAEAQGRVKIAAGDAEGQKGVAVGAVQNAAAQARRQG